MLRFRCHADHAYTANAVLSAQSEEVDRMLGTPQHTHRARAALALRMAELERAEQRHSLADRLERRAREYDDDARLVMGLIRSGFGTADANDETRGSDGKQS